DRVVPAGMEIVQMPFQRILAHGAERRGIAALRRLGAPPHHALARIGTTKAVAEKAALPERRLHALSDRGVLEQRPRYKSANTDQAGIERFWAIRNDMRAHRRMHAVGADQKIAFGAAAVGD